MDLKLLDPVDPILPRAPLSGMADVAAAEDEVVEMLLAGPEDEATAPPEGRLEIESCPRLKGE